MYHTNMIKTKVLVIGINPSDKKIIQNNSTFHRLENWMDQLGIGVMSFANVIPEPGCYRKQDIDYDRLKRLCLGHKKILALGNFVSEALDKIVIEHHKLPHPSPLNRKLNDKQYIDNVIVECAKYLGE